MDNRVSAYPPPPPFVNSSCQPVWSEGALHRFDDDQQLELVFADPSRLVEGDPSALAA